MEEWAAAKVVPTDITNTLSALTPVANGGHHPNGRPAVAAANFLPKHPVPQTQLILQQQQTLLQEQQHLLQQQPQSVSITHIQQPVKIDPNQGTPVATIVLPTEPVAVKSDTTNALVAALAAADPVLVNAAVAPSSSSSSVSPDRSRSPCTSKVIAKTRAELSVCGTSQLRPEAAAHKVHNASRKSKDQVVEELWTHYLSSHADQLEAASQPPQPIHPSTIIETAAVEVAPVQQQQILIQQQQQQQVVRRKQQPHAAAPRATLTLTHMAEAAAAVEASDAAAGSGTNGNGVNGWVGNVIDDEDDMAIKV